MSSLSDKNMRLGDMLLPPGIKQRCLYLRVQGLFTLRKVILMHLYVALSLHFKWDSQLNTSEMFWIDISRWMIRSRCRWISVSGPGVSVCKHRYDIVIWRAENRTHLSKQTRPSTERSRRASNMRGIPSRPDDQL